MPSADQPLVLAAVIGSLRRGSFHRVLFEIAGGLAPEGVEIVEAPVADVPFFNEDIEPDPPAPVVDLQATIRDADGLIFFSPEYNSGVPAVTKNAVDWASRPRGDAPIAHKPTLIIGTTPGRHEIANLREALAVTAQSAGGNVFDQSLGLGSIRHILDDEGGFSDPEAEERMRNILAAFVEFIEDSAQD